MPAHAQAFDRCDGRPIRLFSLTKWFAELGRSLGDGSARHADDGCARSARMNSREMEHTPRKRRVENQ
jgi:hypothetical protein